MRFNNPISPDRLQQFLDQLWLSEASTVLDVGCGKGELIRMLVSQFGCNAVGVDIDAMALERAKESLTASEHKVTLHLSSFDQQDFEDSRFDACFCLGAIHAFGDMSEAHDKALRSLKKLTRPGGVIAIADGYWRKEPDAEYLSGTGISRSEMRLFADNIKAAESIGLECMYCIKASEHEWDHFEGAFWMAAERALVSDPDNIALIDKVKKRREWRDAYMKWGRDTMGFALYAYVVP